MDQTPKCDCCKSKTIDEAIKFHSNAISYIINNCFKKYDDKRSLRSIGMETLWQALLNFEKSKGYSLNGYICTMLRQRMIDEVRSKDGRSESLKKKKWPINHPCPLEEAHDESTDFEWDPRDICFIDGELDAVLEMAGDTLSRILYWKAEGWKIYEACAREGVSEDWYRNHLAAFKKKVIASGLIVRS